MTETNNFITHFEVSNFKKFDHLVVENIGQFNLITGDNNVGKTCLLEALSMNIKDNQELIYKFHHLLCDRGTHYHVENIFSSNPKIPKENYFDFLRTTERKPIFFSFNGSTILLEDDIFFNLSNEELALNKRKKFAGFENELKYWIRIYRNGVLNDVQWMYEDDYYSHVENNLKFKYKPIIGFSALVNKGDLVYYQDEITNNNSITNAYDSEEIIRILKSVILPDGISIINSVSSDGKIKLLTIATESTKADYVPLSQFGDGVQKIVRYGLEFFYVSRNGYNFICLDEIEAGIHFSRLISFWKEFLMLATKLNIQLFATTHSQECIEAYAQALEKLGMEEKGRLIKLDEYTDKLGENKNVATTYNFEEIKFRLHTHTEMRD